MQPIVSHITIAVKGKAFH